MRERNRTPAQNMTREGRRSSVRAVRHEARTPQPPTSPATPKKMPAEQTRSTRTRTSMSAVAKETKTPPASLRNSAKGAKTKTPTSTEAKITPASDRVRSSRCSNVSQTMEEKENLSSVKCGDCGKKAGRLRLSHHVGKSVCDSCEALRQANSGNAQVLQRKCRVVLFDIKKQPDAEKLNTSVRPLRQKRSLDSSEVSEGKRFKCEIQSETDGKFRHGGEPAKHRVPKLRIKRIQSVDDTVGEKFTPILPRRLSSRLNKDKTRSGRTKKPTYKVKLETESSVQASRSRHVPSSTLKKNICARKVVQKYSSHRVEKKPLSMRTHVSKPTVSSKRVIMKPKPKSQPRIAKPSKPRRYKREIKTPYTCAICQKFFSCTVDGKFHEISHDNRTCSVVLKDCAPPPTSGFMNLVWIPADMVNESILNCKVPLQSELKQEDLNSEENEPVSETRNGEFTLDNHDQAAESKDDKTDKLNKPVSEIKTDEHRESKDMVSESKSDVEDTKVASGNKASDIIELRENISRNESMDVKKNTRSKNEITPESENNDVKNRESRVPESKSNEVDESAAGKKDDEVEKSTATKQHDDVDESAAEKKHDDGSTACKQYDEVDESAAGKKDDDGSTTSKQHDDVDESAAEKKHDDDDGSTASKQHDEVKESAAVQQHDKVVESAAEKVDEVKKSSARIQLDEVDESVSEEMDNGVEKSAGMQHDEVGKSVSENMDDVEESAAGIQHDEVDKSASEKMDNRVEKSTARIQLDEADESVTEKMDDVEKSAAGMQHDEVDNSASEKMDDEVEKSAAKEKCDEVEGSASEKRHVEDEEFSESVTKNKTNTDEFTESQRIEDTEMASDHENNNENFPDSQVGASNSEAVNSVAVQDSQSDEAKREEAESQNREVAGSIVESLMEQIFEGTQEDKARETEDTSKGCSLNNIIETLSEGVAEKDKQASGTDLVNSYLEPISDDEDFDV